MNLSDGTLRHFAQRGPNYDRSSVKIGIVHLEIGAFQRAHQAVYIDDLLADDPTWGIIGASLRSGAMAQALNPQNGLYTLVVKTGTQTKARIIGSVKHVIVAADNPAALIAQMAAPNVRIVSLTITEKGYCHHPSTGALNVDQPDIKHDLAHPNAPISAAGMIIAALGARKASGAGPFTILSCDNLPNNGAIMRQVVLELARLSDPTLADWIETHVTFPSTMVDRIVPATTADDCAALAKNTGIQDAAPMVSEPFYQWVIEDNFCAGRPAFESVGVIMTDDVHLFENMKLGLLNGAHSAIAYAGLRRGHVTVAHAIRDAVILKHVHNLWAEMITTFQPPPGVDLDAYKSALIGRFENEALQHALLQIASDGSQKLPQRVLSPIRDRMSSGQPFPALARVVTDWLWTVTERDAHGFSFPLNDPLAATLRPNGTTLKPQDILRMVEFFGEELATNDAFRLAVKED